MRCTARIIRLCCRAGSASDGTCRAPCRLRLHGHDPEPYSDAHVRRLAAALVPLRMARSYSALAFAPTRGLRLWARACTAPQLSRHSTACDARLRARAAAVPSRAQRGRPLPRGSHRPPRMCPCGFSVRTQIEAARPLSSSSRTLYARA
jgi:hypothetical protein